jgi:hypothetical protein
LENAYLTGAFAGIAFSGKLKPLEHYRANKREATDASAISFFLSLKARGVPVKVSRESRAQAGST